MKHLKPREMKCIVLNVSIFFLTITSLLAQPAIEWDKTFGGEHSDFAPIVRLCADGGYIAGGSSVSETISGDKSQPTRGDMDYWVVKFSKDGTKQWDKRFGGSKTDQLTTLIATSDGGYLMGGTSWSDQGGDKSDALNGINDIWIVKIDSSGTKEWDKSYGGMGGDRLGSISQTRDGGFILGAAGNYDGADPSTSVPKSFFWLVKITDTGIVLWDKSPGDKLSAVSFIEETPDLGYIMAGSASFGAKGYKSEPGYGGGDYWIVKVDSNLNKVWDRTIGGTSSDIVSHMEQTDDGGYILGGYSNSPIGGLKTESSRGYSDYWVVKISRDGLVEWDKTLGGNEDDWLIDLRETADGNFFVAGSSFSGINGDKTQSSGGFGYWSVKLSKTGVKMWDKAIRSSDHDDLSSVEYVPDGGYLLAGVSISDKGWDKSEDSRGSHDYWIVKLQSDETPKPFRLSYFKAQKAATQVDLVWETKTERGSDRFEVQHSLNKSAWQVLASVHAKDTSYLRSRYQYAHANPALVKHYYRLRMTASNGKRTYSAIDSADYTPPAPWVSPYVIAWDKTLGGADSDSPNAVEQTIDGGFILGGSSSENSAETGDRTEPSRGGLDYWIVKISADGQKEWDKTFGGSDTDALRSVQQTADGGYILGGGSYSSASGDKSEDNGGTSNPEDRQPDFWIIKTSSTGAMEWERSIVRRGEELLRYVRATKDGGYLAWGTYYMVKLSPTGKIEWERDDVRDVVWDWDENFEQADGSFYALGMKSGGFNIVKLSANGNIESDRMYAASTPMPYRDYGDYAFTRLTSDGGMIMVGTTETGIFGDKTEPSRGGKDIWVIKVAADGTKQWDKTFGGSGNDQRGSIAPTSDGGYMVSVQSDSPVSGDKSGGINGTYDAWLIKITADGTKQWDQSYGGSKYQVQDTYYTGNSALGLLEERADGYIVSGSSSGKSSDDKTSDVPGAWTLKLALDGTKIWDKTFEGPSGLGKAFNGGYYTYASSAANAGNVKTEDSKGKTDFWIVRIASIDDKDPLPVTLTTFTARKESTTALLTWQTTSETRSSHFEIEHSVNAKTWNHLTSVNALGESAQLHNYQFVHQNPVNGDNYYRLKMVDTDGSFTYSKVEQVSFVLDFDVNVYPNPASEIIHFQASDWTKVKRVEVLNAQGKVVYRSGKKPVQQLNAEAFGTGLYFVKIIDINGSETVRKIVVGR
ncbi:T9SS type A sorting domain-containing protein [Dyadobacter sandarakinus]|uniref:T9SS type A sorting domain-containing protein n=1 Tax=Dyadobacter sandarakinus TaxID=2747268 RepID=A0ABX7I6E4_9BACT|nr:T9SS type A sorting domain-containing protein [Dyadobacter sandarakinus]QRR01454.1 T9SS type A sorting domain-containing protein [Dyadobacter sandarakinus]